MAGLTVQHLETLQRVRALGLLSDNIQNRIGELSTCMLA